MIARIAAPAGRREGPATMLQRRCACGGTPGLDGECAECRQKRLSRQASRTPGPETAPAIVHDVLRSPGRPLEPAMRAFMEPRLGHDFADVRVHTGALAAESAAAVSARAYTVGRHVAFAQGEYRPDTAEGRRLLAHELAHVVQQRGAGRAVGLARQAASPTPAVGTAPAAAIRTVKVWLNAFIPDSVPGKTLAAPAPHTGKTMLNGPPFSQCYLTDNRGFDADVAAPSRMHSEIEIDVSGPKETFQWHDCSETHEIHCKTGAAVCTRKGPTTNMRYSNLRGSAASTIQVDLAAASNNPCYGGSPDIDYEGVVTIDVGARRVDFDGKIDEFPAYEMYATANAGAGKPLFTTSPAKGKDPWDLWAKANQTQPGTTTI